jgi:GTPase SAR1 family protein
MATNDVRADRKIYRVVLVGDSLSGKSSLLASFLPNRFRPNHTSSPSTTIQVDDKMVNNSTVVSVAS